MDLQRSIPTPMVLLFYVCDAAGNNACPLLGSSWGADPLRNSLLVHPSVCMTAVVVSQSVSLCLPASGIQSPMELGAEHWGNTGLSLHS